MFAAIGDDTILDIHHVIYQKCTPTWVMPKNKLGSINMTYITQGAARYTVNNEAANVEQGSLLVLPKDSTRSAVTFSNQLMHCFSVEFTLRNDSGDLSPPLPLVSAPGCHKNIIHNFHELSFSWMDANQGYMFKCKGLLMLILHQFMELLVYKDSLLSSDFRITKVIRYIAMNYSERITVKSMADMVNLNPTYFGGLFHQTTGTSLNHYLTQIRIKNAEAMLASGEYKISDVAEVCGFTDTSHFYKHFHVLRGFPPSECLPKGFYA